MLMVLYNSHHNDNRGLLATDWTVRYCRVSWPRPCGRVMLCSKAHVDMCRRQVYSARGDVLCTNLDSSRCHCWYQSDRSPVLRGCSGPTSCGRLDRAERRTECWLWRRRTSHESVHTFHGTQVVHGGVTEGNYSVSQKNPNLRSSDNFSQTVGSF